MTTTINVLFCFIHVLLLCNIEAQAGGGFSVDLIHRDSPLSPLYNPSSTKLDRLNDAFRRSFHRATRFNPTLKSNSSDNSTTIQSDIVPASGEYLMKLSIGTPPFEMLGIADTGSDLTWTQCKPCTQCYKQNSPLFDPENSSSYKSLPCNTQICQSVAISNCSDQNNCQYKTSYGDQSYSLGDLAVDTFTFGSDSVRPVSIPKVVFGCGHNNDGTFNETASGIFGLGGGTLSFVAQMSDLIDGKFSYCLVSLDADSNVTSKINFGESAVVSGPNVVSTPIVKKNVDTFYYLTLESVAVGNKSLAYKKPFETEGGGVEEGNIIIDSGTTLTFLPGYLYQDLEMELKQVINAETIDDPEGVLSLCYSGGSDLDLPTITFKFTGAELELPPQNSFIRNGDLVCLAMVASDELAIFGNLSQMNLLIGYDLVKKEVSFLPTDCSK